MAAQAATTRTADNEQWSIFQTKIEADRHTDSATLETRLAPLISIMIAQNNEETMQTATSDRANILTSLAHLEQHDREAASAWADLSETGRALQAGVAAPVAPVPSVSSPTPTVLAPALTPGPATQNSEGASAWGRNWHGRPPTVGRGREDIPSVMSAAGGPDVVGVGNNPRHPFSGVRISNSDRSRHTLCDEQRDRDSEAALLLDCSDCDAKAARERDTQAGVAAMQGRGSRLPNPVAPMPREPNSIMGRGSSECYTGLASSITFTGSSVSERYAATALFGGAVAQSGVGRPYVSKAAYRKFTGLNRGVTDSPTTGICAINFINQFIAAQSILKHETNVTRERALREDLLSQLPDGVRTTVATSDERGSWGDLIKHFLQTCGPPDIRAGIYTMLDGTGAEEPERNLQQRVLALVFGWNLAQVTFYGVFPELDDAGEDLPPRHCNPFVSVHQPHAALKELTLRCGGGTLWQSYCTLRDHRIQNNPVTLLHYLLALDTEALQMPVHSNLGKTQLRVTGRQSQSFVTTGDPQAQMVPLLVADAKSLDKRAVMGDARVEDNGVAYDASRIRGVNDTAFRFCTEANISEAVIRKRHDDHQCYYCGENVRGAGGLIVHTFWQCPDRLKVDEEINDRLRATEQAEGRCEGASVERNRNSQYQANERRSEVIAYNDADQD